MYNVGDILKVKRFGGVYYHFGVYVGDGMVVHYSGELLEKKNAKIIITNYDKFADGDEVFVDTSVPSKFSGAEIAKRALDKVGHGENEYFFFLNNCEHFANWCRTGKQKCTQLEEIISDVIAKGPLNVFVEKISLALEETSKQALIRTIVSLTHQIEKECIE